MTMNLSCLIDYPPAPLVPMLANDSSAIHPKYTPDGGGISQMISSAMALSTFSINDVESLLKNVFNTNTDPWDTSKILKTKPIPSMIIYSSIALALFLIFSIIFCVVSCCNTKKKRSDYDRKKRQSKSARVFVCLLTIIYLLGIGDMIYVTYRINKSKVSLDDSIREMNQDVYPKEISEHMTYLINQIETLDEYFNQTDSILINTSKSMLIKAFVRILDEKYFVQDILQSVNSMDIQMKELTVMVDQETTLPELARTLFRESISQYQEMVKYLQMPVEKICDYANETHSDIDEKLLVGLDVVHQQLRKVINTINDDILSKITPWQNYMLMDTDTEEQIRYYMSLTGIVFLVLAILLLVIPLVFFILIVTCRLCNDEEDEVPFKNMNSRRHRSHTKSERSNGSSGVWLCLMRMGFGVMIIMLIIMVLLTGVYYSLDLLIQGACRTAHDDQPFLVSFLTDKFIGTNVVFINGTNVNTTVMNVIHDCRDQVHFSRRLIENYWTTLDRDVTEMMNMLSKQIYDQFIESIGLISIPEDISLLNRFLSLASIGNIPAKVQEIETNFNTIDANLVKINDSNSILPMNLVQTTVVEFKDYVKKVLESTVDGCPLPLTTIYKTDTLVCHTLGSSLSGLWLSVFLYMFLVTVGICIFGLYIYKRLN